LRGEKVKGSFALVRTKDRKQWLVIKHKDRFVTTEDVTARRRSVLSGVTVEDLKVVPAHRMPAARLIPAGEIAATPATLAPMQAETADAPFDHPDWMWEPKLDGYRILVFIDADGVRMRSRRNLELSGDFPRIAAELAKHGPPGTILDGEIVGFDAAGKPSFNAMQNRASTVPIVFYAFDMTHFAGIDLRKSIYRDRRRYLAQCLLPSALIQLVHASPDGVELHSAALATGFEGVVGKRIDSRYESGRRSGSWLKVKPMRSAEFVVGGFTQGSGLRSDMGALLVGYWEGGKLRYASHVGSGFDGKTLDRVKARLVPLTRKSNPFSEKPELNAPTTWTEPEVVAEVSFQSWTKDGRLRSPVFLRLRDDIDPKGVRRENASPSPALKRGQITFSQDDSVKRKSNLTPFEGGGAHEILSQLDNTKTNFTLEVGPHRIRLTHLDRVYWPANPALQQPALTKRDLLRYFTQVSPFILPHLADRPLTMIRMPDGIGGQRFFQKHWEQERPEFADTITVFSGHKDESHAYLVCNNLPTLLWLAQSGTLEFHVWHSRAKPGADAASESTDYATSLESLEQSILNYPDYVLFDIDPYIYSGKEAKGAEPELNTVAFEKGKEVAFHLRELLQTMSLEPIVKTSGKTGLHVFVPIRRTLDFDAARHVSELVGRHLMRLHPKDITLEWSVPKRTGKIFMDYNMNVRGKTLNVAYSPRGEPGAPVSMPLTWEELAGAHPLDFRITNAPQRLAGTGDRWRDALKEKQNLERALRGKKA